MLKVVVGHSHDPDSRLAIAEIIEKCILELGEVTPQAGILFAGWDFDHALVLEQIDQAFPGIELIGGTTDGEISSKMGYQQDSLVLMLFASDEIEIHAGLGRGLSKDAEAAAKQAVTSALAKSSKEVKFCLTIPESLTVGGDAVITHLLKEISENIPGYIPIFGGLAGSISFQHPVYQFFQTEVLQDAVPILLFSGSILFSQGVANGWCPIGKQCRVNKAKGNIVYEIAGKSTLEFYQSYLGQPPSEEYPLAVFADEYNFYTRSPFNYDAEIGSVTFGGDVPQGSTVQIAEATRDKILFAASTSIRQALGNYPGQKPNAAILFSCLARRRILASRTEKENQFVQELLGDTVNYSGFYTFGEIGPLIKAIADNGCGISEDIKQRIFDPFFTTKPIGKGTGMGMSISYQTITEKHGGKLEFISQLKEGTEFLIQIPIRQE